MLLLVYYYCCCFFFCPALLGIDSPASVMPLCCYIVIRVRCRPCVYTFRCRRPIAAWPLGCENRVSHATCSISTYTRCTPSPADTPSFDRTVCLFHFFSHGPICIQIASNGQRFRITWLGRVALYILSPCFVRRTAKFRPMNPGKNDHPARPNQLKMITNNSKLAEMVGKEFRSIDVL